MKTVTFQVIVDIEDDDFAATPEKLDEVLNEIEDIVAKLGWSLNDSLVEEEDC